MPKIATSPANMNISQNENVKPQIVTGICINVNGTVKSQYAKSLILVMVLTIGIIETQHRRRIILVQM